MGMGTRQSQEMQEEIWIANAELARSPGHPFYQRLNELLESEKFDVFVEGFAASFTRPPWGVPVWFRGFIFARFSSAILRASRASAALRGGWPILWRCGVSCASG